jgi:hypothetical protein
MSTSVSNSSLTGVTLNVTSGNPPVPVGTQTIPVASLSVGANSVQINDSSILAAIGSGTTINYSLSCSYANGKSVVSTAGTPYPPLTFVSTKLHAHYDASDASSYTLSGGNVTQWNDLAGKGYHLTANGTGPTLTTIKSVPAFNFNPGRGLIRTSVPLSSEITIFMVIKYSTNIGIWGSFMHHGSRDSDWALERNSWSTTTHNIQFQSSNINGPPELSATNGVNYILVGRISGNNREFWRYSDTEALGFATGSGVSIVTGNKSIYVGKSDNNEACNSTIGEILYYNASLSDADVTKNVTYLQKKWFNM